MSNTYDSACNYIESVDTYQVVGIVITMKLVGNGGAQDGAYDNDFL